MDGDKPLKQLDEVNKYELIYSEYSCVGSLNTISMNLP